MKHNRIIHVLLLLAIFSLISISPLYAQLVDLKELNYSKQFEKMNKKAEEDTGIDFCFVILGDTRENLATAKMVFAKAADENPAFILHTGDLTNEGTLEELKEYYLASIEDISPIPIVPVPGNHDKGSKRNFSEFNAVFGAKRFFFDYGPCRFVGINNGDFNAMSYSDIRYIKKHLSEPDPVHKFVIFHIPPRVLTKESAYKKGRGFRNNSRIFFRLMKKYEVDNVFMGHIHGYMNKVLNKTYFTITGGGGAPLTSRLDHENSVNHFIVVHVSKNGLRREVVRFLDNQWVRETIN